PKSAIYGNVLPLLNSGRVELLDHPRLQAQLLSLERRASRGRGGTIDHPPGAHDDVADAACGALALAVGGRPAAEGPMGVNLAPHPYVPMNWERLERGMSPASVRHDPARGIYYGVDMRMSSDPAERRQEKADWLASGHTEDEWDELEKLFG